MAVARAISVALLASMLLSSLSPASAALTCNQLYSALYPCLNYMMGGPYLQQCCDGIRGIMSVTQTTADRQTACGCLKALSGNGGGGAYVSRAAALPGLCHINFPYHLDPNIDCSKVK